jgi:hypothetical protein
VISLPQLLKDKPLIHQGRSLTWAIHPDLASFLEETLTSSHVTLETGSGLSTLVILRKQVAQHIAITPSSDEIEAIRSFCREHGLDAAPLHAVVAPSQDYLPLADLPSLDLVLIDGEHAFPIPFFDWWYTADKLKVGGWMIVDDTNIVTGTILAEFMRVDPKWQEITWHWSGRFAIFKKLRHPVHDGGWSAQPYLRNTWNTYPTGSVKPRKRRPPGLLERAMTKILPWQLIQMPLRARIGWPRPE